jgi:hypothetical protein
VTEGKAKDAADAVRGLAESVGVPAVIHPAATKSVKRLAAPCVSPLGPLRALVWGFEQFEEFLYDSRAEEEVSEVGELDVAFDIEREVTLNARRDYGATSSFVRPASS